MASAGNTFTSTEIFSSIVSANANNDDVDFVNGTTNSFKFSGFNLLGNGNATGAFNQPGDRTGVTNPLLGTLADNGGPTQTHVLLAGSPAIDTGTNTGCPTIDQRGVSRPQGPTCDIGAFEAIPPPSPGGGHHKKHHHHGGHHHKHHHGK